MQAHNLPKKVEQIWKSECVVFTLFRVYWMFKYITGKFKHHKSILLILLNKWISHLRTFQVSWHNFQFIVFLFRLEIQMRGLRQKRNIKKMKQELQVAKNLSFSLITPLPTHCFVVYVKYGQWWLISLSLHVVSFVFGACVAGGFLGTVSSGASKTSDCTALFLIKHPQIYQPPRPG